MKQGMDRRLVHISQEANARAPTWWWVVQRIPQWNECSQAYKPTVIQPKRKEKKKKISKAWKSQEH